MLRRQPRVTSRLNSTVAANGYCACVPVQHHRTCPEHTGPVRRELRKLARSPDTSHRTHPERPVLTGLMRREGHQNARTPDAEHQTHSGPSGALCTPAPQTPHGRSGPASGATNSSVRCEKHSRDFSKFTTSAIENIHLTFSKSAKSHTPLNPRNSTSIAKVPTPPSVHHHVHVC